MTTIGVAPDARPVAHSPGAAHVAGIVNPDYSGPNDEVMIQVLNFTDADVQNYSRKSEVRVRTRNRTLNTN